MTNQEIITSVQNLLQDNQFATIQITEAANWLQDEIFNRVKTRMMETADVITASAGDTTAAFPSNMQTMLSLYLTSPTPPIDMDRLYVDYETFIRRYPDYSTATASPLRHWTDFANGLLFSNPLDTAIVMPITFLRRPVPMVGLNDVCEIPDNYREIISRGTLARCMEQNEDYGEAQSERNNIEPLITTFILREGRGRIKTGPTIMKNNRRRGGGSGHGAYGAWGD